MAHASEARECLARRASGAAEAAVWNWVDPWASPLPQQPARRLGAGLAAKGSPGRFWVAGVHWSWKEEKRRRGSDWSLSVFSLGIFFPFLGLFHGFLSSMVAIFPRLLLR